MNSSPSLRALHLLPAYDRETCPDLVQDFFLPVLHRATRYDRTTYNFDPKALAVAAAGLVGLINNGGRMRLICHHELSADVVEAVLAGQRTAEEALLESMDPQFITRIAPDDLTGRHHLGLLTWLVKAGRLDIKVAIPNRRGAIFHQKIGLFADGQGNRIGFNGSLNESQAAWVLNDEGFSLFTSWNESAHLKPLVKKFEQLWANRYETLIVIPIPEALRQNLIAYAPKENPARRILPKPNPAPADIQQLRARLWTAIKQAVRHDPQTMVETCAAQLWPHQLAFWRRYAREAEKPPRVLIADEVGLGKTIQAGALLKTLINRELARRVLILVPAVSRWQWQEELRHKFNIAVPVLDRAGGKLRFIHPDGAREDASPDPWRDAFRLIVSYDWLRRHYERFLQDEMPDYDLIIFDEAHHARYKDIARRQDNAYLTMLKGLARRTCGLLLLTATPMQIDPVELWALLQVLNPTGQWAENEFRRFYDVNRPSTLIEWDRARRTYLKEGLPGSPEQIAELARMPLPAAQAHLDYIRMPASNPALKRDMDSQRIRDSYALMRRSSAITRSVSRHTRNLLRQYVREGKLKQSVPARHVCSIPVRMNDVERGMYDDITELVREAYQGRSDLNRPALGFVMTGLRIRFVSSRYAFRQSLQRLRQRHRSEERTVEPLTKDWDHREGDSYADVDPDADLPAVEFNVQERNLLTDLLSRCDVHLEQDSKFSVFLQQLARLREAGYGKVMVFSQFRDTQVWLRERLAACPGSSLLAGLSGAEDWIYAPDTNAFRPVPRRDVMAQFRHGADGVLLCTETAAESLNFQFCAAIVNYDIPWNPMRLEQRIGRIDRIGQEKKTIRIVHLFYQDTAEYDAYQAMEARIQDFQANVGTLQPILAANLEGIIRDHAGERADTQSIQKAVHSLAPVGFDLDDLAAATSEQLDAAPRLHLNDLTYILNCPELWPEGYSVAKAGRDHWRVTAPDGYEKVVTTNRTAYDYAAGTVDFFGPGCPVFPDPASLEIGEDISVKQSQSCVREILRAYAR